MSFSAMEKTKIVVYMGFPGSVLDIDSVNYHGQITERLTGLSSQVERLVRKKLTRIELMDTKLEGNSSKAGVKRVDDIEFFTGGEGSRELKKERNRLIREMGEMLDIPANRGGSMANVSI